MGVYLVNPWFLAYSNLTGMLDVAKPGAIIVTGRGNRYDPAFQEARKRGAKVYSYWNVANAPGNLSNPEDASQYLINGAPPPRWPYKNPDGTDRSQWSGTYLLDLRPGSEWLKHIVAKSEEVIKSGKFDGFFLDTLGARLWATLVDWGSWSVAEQTAWASGSINIAKELALVADRVNPAFELVHNNLWDLPSGHPFDAQAQEGDKYCNGVCLENPQGASPGAYHVNYAGRTFGRLPRRVLVIDTTDADTVLWSKVPGVTHVTSIEKATSETYAKVTPPVVPFTGWGTEEVDMLKAQIDQLKALVAQLEIDVAKVEAEAAAATAKATQETQLRVQIEQKLNQIRTIVG
jgi:outer membrane murein-binding lipoprotein Lpp